MRRRALIYAALAVTVPLPALAVPGRGGPAELPQQSLSVAASLDSCGTAANSIVCKIDASWNDIAGATRYTASVARADGSVVNFGDVGAGSGSFWVPYAGDGTYTVTVSAHGTSPGEGEPKVVARDRSAASAEPPKAGIPAEPGPDAVGGELPAEERVDPGTEPDAPPCKEAEPEPVEPPTEDTAAAEEGDAPAALSGEAVDEPDASAELPEAVGCPAEPASGPSTG